MTKDQAAALIDLLIDRAPKLREAGVLELGIEGATMKLAPLVEAGTDVGQDDERQPENVWADPTLYGRTSSVPGRDPRRKEP